MVVSFVKDISVFVCVCVCAHVCVTDRVVPWEGMDYLPHQEAKMKAGMEKALQPKEKLLEYDRNRYTAYPSV